MSIEHKEQDPIDESGIESVESDMSDFFEILSSLPYVLGSDTSEPARASARSVVLGEIIEVAQMYEVDDNIDPGAAYAKAKSEYVKDMRQTSWYKNLPKDAKDRLNDMIAGDTKIKSGGFEGVVPGKAVMGAVPGALQQTGEYTQPSGSPVQYKKEYQNVFGGYSVDAFRQHLAQSHPELARQTSPPEGRREKATQILAAVNGIIRGFGFLLGLKRVKAKTKKGEPDYYAKIFEEREELRELVYAKIMLPMLKQGAVPGAATSGPQAPSILQQDQLAQQAPGMPSSSAAQPGPFRIGAIIDIEKLNISTEALRNVLMGRTSGPSPPVSGESGIEAVESDIGDKPDIGEVGELDQHTKDLIDENASPEIKVFLEGLKSRPLVQQKNKVRDALNGAYQRLNAQIASEGGDGGPRVKELRGDVRALQLYEGWVLTEFAKRVAAAPSDPGTPAVPAPVVPAPVVPRPQDRTKDTLKKKVKAVFIPSRRRLIQKAKNLVLKRIPDKSLSLNKDPVRRPENVNSFAPTAQEDYRGGIRAIM